MMDTRPLTLLDQSLISSKFSRLNLQLSEYSFANLYLFRELHHYQIVTINGELFIKGGARDGTNFMMLTSHPQNIPRQILLEASTQADIFYPVPDSWLPFLEDALIQHSFKDEDSDYLFSVSKFAEYPGRHLSKKRNLVKQLFRSHEIIEKDFSPALLADAESVLDSWVKGRTDNLDTTDYKACKEGLQLFQELRLHGRLIYVDHIPSGFLIGEWLSEDCYVVHFDKVGTETKGLYQYLFQDLGHELVEKTPWINIEQDLGLPELRQSKHSYLPDFLLRKWRIKLR